MATIIDSLLVVLGLDTKGFDAGRKRVGEGFKKTREETDKSGKNIEGFGKKSENAIKSLKNEAIGLFLAFQGASSLQGFIGNMITGDAAAGRLAKNLGMSVTTLTAYGLAIQSVGGEASEANAALGLLAGAREQLKLTGTTGHDREFALMGFGPHDLDDTAKAFDKLAEAAQRMPRTQFYNLAKQMGLSDGVINLLELGPAKMHALIKAREADAAATQADADASAALQAKWADLVAKITAIMRPEIYKLVDGLLDIVDAMTKGKNMGPAFNAVLIAIAGTAAILGAPFTAAAAAILLVVTNLDALRKAYAHAVWYTHGWGIPGGFAAYDAMVKAGMHSTADIDRVLDQDTANQAASRAAGDASVPVAGGGGGGGSGAPARGSVMSSAHDSEYILAYLKGSGLSDGTARGIAAGIAAEGGSLGMAKNGAFGLGQWRGKRREALFRMAGTRTPGLQAQMRFLMSELRGGDAGGASVLAQGEAGGALEAYIRNFMRPGPGVGGDLRRGYSWLGSRYRGGGGGGGGGGSTQVTIGQINLPGVKDANGFAQQLPAAIRRRGVTAQANRGLD